MYSTMAQPQGRRGTGRSRSVSRGPMHYDHADAGNDGRSKQPYQGASQNIHRSRSKKPTPPIPRRRSLSAQRRSSYHSHGSSHHHQMHYAKNLHQPIHHDGSSDAGSAKSAPSSKNSRDFRDPQNTMPNGTYNKLQRDESPIQGRRMVYDTPQKYVKIVRRVIDDLNRAAESGPHQRRIASMTNACGQFDHGDDLKHNIELQNGAARVFCKVLNTTDDEDEVRLACSGLEMVFRAQNNYVHVTFDKCGSSLLSNLLRLLESADTGNMAFPDVCILNISKVLLYISRVPELRMNLARNVRILAALKRVSSSSLNPECRVIRIRIAANLVNCDDNKTHLLEHHGFLDSLLRVAHMDASDLAREYAGVALMDLASSPGNQIRMTHNPKLLGTLVKMVLVEKVSSTRESAITALQNLAFTKENRLPLVRFKEGIVLEALRKAVSTDQNDKSRRRAAGALTNLACDETAETMGSHKGLLDTLATVSNKDENKDVQGRAAMALTKLAASITIKMASYSTLLDALVVSSLSQASNGVTTVLRVKARDPENRESMAQHPGVLDTLADICISPVSELKDKDNAMRALMHLTNENSNRKRMCNRKVLEALVHGAFLDEARTAEVRDSAIRAIERLATEFSNRPHMARHNGLLVAIAKATEREAKLEDAGAKRDHAFLAKPLLMSLLVAM